MKEQEGKPTAEKQDDPNDPERLDRERRQQVTDEAAKIRAAGVPRDTEPPLVYRP